MDDRTITVSISDEEQAFIDSEIASGRYASGSDVIRAGLAALEYAETTRPSAAEAVGDAVLEGFSEPASLAKYLSDNADQLELTLKESEASGESTRAIPDIMEAVKSKLRANGSL